MGRSQGGIWVPADCRYDADRAEEVVDFFELALVHTKGRYARKPFLLAGWQAAEIIRPLFGTMRYEEQLEAWVRAYSLAWIELGRKNGKLLVRGTPIPTPSGWRPIEDLVPGDCVFAIDGRRTRVLWSSRPQVVPGYRVCFADGSELEAGDNHRWLVNDRVQGRHGNDPRRVITTAELAASLHSGIRGDRRYTVPVPGPIQPGEVPKLGLDPWVLGYWLGNGATRSGRLASGGHGAQDDCDHVLSRLRAAGLDAKVSSRGARKAEISVPGLKGLLAAAGVLGCKHIPEGYVFAPESARRELLAGLLDSDGTCSSSAPTPQIEYCSTSERLADDVLTVVRSLGWKATIRKGVAMLRGIDMGPKFRVTFTAYADEAPFSLIRKNAGLPVRPDRAPRSRTNAVVAVEPIGEIEGFCIAVDHPSHVFLAGRGFTPTHNSELVAGCGLYLLTDAEEGAEIFGCAEDKDQAKVIYRVAKRMVELSPLLSRRLKVIDSALRIVDPKTESFYEVVAADGSGNLGSNPYGVLFDEVITQPNRELWDALKTGMGTRDEPLMLAATTAGNDPSSMAAEEHLHSEGVVADPSIDPSRFAYMRNTPQDADWRDEAGWHHANPALGDFLRIQVLRDEAKEAERSIRKQNTFRQFRLNQWVRQVTRWLDLGLWDENAGLVVEEQLEGRECFGGLDLSSTSDFTAWVMYFPGIHGAGAAPVLAEGEEPPLPDPEMVPDADEGDFVVARFFLPEAALAKRSHMRDLLEDWTRNGFITVTPGEVIDYDAVFDQVVADAGRFNIGGIGYDRWNSSQLVVKLREEGAVLEAVAQTANELNGPSKELERLLGRRRLHHGGNPVLRWMADNVQVFTDRNGNIKPDRAKSNEKIDGIAALVNALHRALAGAAGGSGDFAVFVGMGS